MDELLQDFLEEAYDHLEKIDTLILQLEKKPNDKTYITDLFRSVHSIKGTCGMFGFQKLSEVSHKAEDLLSKMREGEIQVSSKLISLLLASFDIIRIILNSIKSSGEEPNQSFEKLNNALTGALKNSASAQEVSEKSTEVAETPDSLETITTENMALSINNDDTEKTVNKSNETLKVKLDILDKIMNCVGELVLSRNQLMELGKKINNIEYDNNVNHLNYITSTLQETVMKTRMRPIGEAWSKLPRMIRDLEKRTGKNINLVMKGESTELDRQILQAIQDPLTHCIRNSLDHGVETPETRKEKQKPETGTIELTATQDGGDILITIKDDGKGIDPDILIHKSLEKEIISENDAKIMSKEQALQLIFAPGFSTAQEVTDISGRGVGMDVVRSSIQNLGGNVNIDSEVGLYTKIEFRIPLTMAIISALTVKIKQGEQFSTYAIPQTCISELVQINTKNVNNIKSVYNTLVFKIHGNILPLVFLSNILQSDYNNKSIDKEGLLDKSIVFISVDDKKFGIIIDEVIETQEIVVKSISHVFEQLKSISGATILGDGSVILIIDAAQIANIINFQQVYKASEQVIQDISQANQNETDSRQVDLLTFKTDETKCKSVELSNVDRLEEFMPQNIEHANGIYLIQYRGDLIPLYSFDQNFKPESTKQDQFIPTIIIRKNGQFIGLITHQIEDIVQYDGEFKEIGKHDYIKGVSVVNGRTLDIINTDYLFDYFNHETKVS